MNATLLKATLLVAALLTLGACNTMKGLGEDIQHAGEKIGEAVKSKK